MGNRKKSRIRVGCSGWNYKHWKGVFYPEDMPQKKWFAFYARIFDTVEINNTFYNLPSEKTFRSWADQAESNFLYSVKANRYITHIKRLKEPEKSLKRFFERARLLGKHLGPILYQLPPNWRCDIERLRNFLEHLPGDLVHVFEFRDQRWLNDEVFDSLGEAGVSFCVHDMEGLEVPRKAMGPVVYVRFHGYDGKYEGQYPEQSLRPWAKWLNDEAGRRDIYAYFNNDQGGHAIGDAKTLRSKLVGD